MRVKINHNSNYIVTETRTANGEELSFTTIIWLNGSFQIT